MIPVSQIEAENLDPLTDAQLLGLRMLVKQYPGYTDNIGLWPGLDTKLAEEVAIPTAKTQGLKAVLTQLEELPALDLEKQGQTYLSTRQNWYMLAQDALDILFEVTVATGAQFVSVTRKPIADIRQYDSVITNDRVIGRRY